MEDPKTPSITQALTRARDYLRSKQLDDGSWSYKSGQKDPSLEASSWVSLALTGDSETLAKVFKFFVSAQNQDGGFSTAPGLGPSSWMTGPVVLAMRILEKEVAKPEDLAKAVSKSIDRALIYMSESRVEFYPAVARLLILLSKGTDGLRYSRGWPWDRNCFHWVEPTSYNLMALKCGGVPESHKGYFTEIVEIAEKFILEHSCQGGGWNHGNNRTLGEDLPPYRVTTAEALLVLQEFKDKSSVAQGLKYLSSLRDQDSSSMSLAWSILALNAFEKDNAKEIEFLLNRQKEDGSFGDNLMVDGLSCLALASTTNNVLKYPS